MWGEGGGRVCWEAQFGDFHNNAQVTTGGVCGGRECVGGGSVWGEGVCGGGSVWAEGVCGWRECVGGGTGRLSSETFTTTLR